MANSHDRAARLVARKFGCRYTPSTSPDVRCKHVRVEVKTYASEVPTALRQLAGGTGPAFIALPKTQHKKALQRLEGLKTGLVDYKGNIIKPSARK